MHATTAMAPATATTKRSVRGGIAGNDDVIFIGRIPRGATQGAMKQFLQTIVEDVTKVRFVIDPRTRHHRGYGFARFGSAESAAKVLKMAKTREGLVFCGKRLNAGHSSMTDDSASDADDMPPAFADDEEDEGIDVGAGLSQVSGSSGVMPLPSPVSSEGSMSAVVPLPMACVAPTPQPVLQYVVMQQGQTMQYTPVYVFAPQYAVPVV